MSPSACGAMGTTTAHRSARVPGRSPCSSIRANHNSILNRTAGRRYDKRADNSFASSTCINLHLAKKEVGELNHELLPSIDFDHCAEQIAGELDSGTSSEAETQGYRPQPGKKPGKLRNYTSPGRS